MKKILYSIFILIIVPFHLFGEDTTYLPKVDNYSLTKTNEEHYKNFNIIDLGYSYSVNHLIDNKGDDKPLATQTNLTTSIDSYNDYYFNDQLSLLTSLNYFNIENPVFNETADKNIKVRNALTITEFRLRYMDDYSNTYTIGILPMFKGIAYKYDSFDFTRNDGSHYISGLILQGVEYTHKFGENDPLYIALGYGYYEKIHINNIELHNKLIRGSDGKFLYIKKIINFKDLSKLEYYGEFSQINFKYRGTLGYEQNLIGNTLSYIDDSNTIWGFWGHQNGKGDNTFLVRDALNIPSSIPDQYLYTNTPTSFVGPYKTTGDSIALGYKRSFDIGRTENFILGEYYQTFGEWVTPNYGEPFSNYGLGRLGKQYKLSLGHFCSSNLLMKFTYYDLHQDKDYKEGGSMKQNDIQLSGTKDRNQQYLFNIQYLF